MNLKSMTIRIKLAIAFVSLAFMVVLVGLMAMKSLRDADERFDSFVHGNYARLMLSYEFRTAVDKRAIAARDLINAATPSDRAAIKAEVLQAHAEAQERINKLTTMATAPGVSDEARKRISKLAEAEAKYAPVALDIVNLALEGHRDDAVNKMNSECRPLLAALNEIAKNYRDFTVDSAEGFVRKAGEDYTQQRLLVILICIFTFILAIVAGTLITISLTRALGAEPNELGDAAKRVASGDLREVPGASNAREGSVLASIGHMQESLVGIVEQVRNASNSIATGSTQIAFGNADLSQRTEVQASNVQQTAASMEQLSSTVQTSADVAREANQLAVLAAEAARQGGEKVDLVVSAMHDISQSSQKISDIIGVIDGIAFQTNILALNAAVEAARAGEQGRGFAVVASEVRTLAQRSAGAAKEIKNLIDVSVERVEAGSKQVDEAGASMQRIVSQVQQVSQMIGNLSNSATEQAQGISQVGGAVQQLDQVTQQNAALVEKTSAAAENLKDRAKQMAQVMSFFKV